MWLADGELLVKFSGSFNRLIVDYGLRHGLHRYEAGLTYGYLRVNIGLMSG